MEGAYGDINQVKVIDNFLDEENYSKLVQFIDKHHDGYEEATYRPTRWIPGHKSIGEAANTSWFWTMPVTDVFYFSTTLLQVINKKLKQEHTLERVYFNGMSFGQNAEFHWDDTRDEARTSCYTSSLVISGSGEVTRCFLTNSIRIFGSSVPQ